MSSGRNGEVNLKLVLLPKVILAWLSPANAFKGLVRFIWSCSEGFYSGRQHPNHKQAALWQPCTTQCCKNKSQQKSVINYQVYQGSGH